ncbi:hypothetical protein AF335_16980 [Streptomyces eurocidicus]|uniref:Uncharacterized protein n=1 Tax=Streptomyces eurocidicus TaxID=66423 RepID=A0A2N8NU64_STREU|nr:hypothetical protein AF335_16980 [Streptomyces eurocidicus]
MAAPVGGKCEQCLLALVCLHAGEFGDVAGGEVEGAAFEEGQGQGQVAGACSVMGGGRVAVHGRLPAGGGVEFDQGAGSVWSCGAVGEDVRVVGDHGAECLRLFGGGVLLPEHFPVSPPQAIILLLPLESDSFLSATMKMFRPLICTSDNGLPSPSLWRYAPSVAGARRVRRRPLSSMTSGSRPPEKEFAVESWTMTGLVERILASRPPRSLSR